MYINNDRVTINIGAYNKHARRKYDLRYITD